jgi:hypothetical protein
MSAEATGKAQAPVLVKEDDPGVGGVDTKIKDESGPSSEPSSGSELGEAESGTIDEKALLRKLDWRLLPAVGVLYLLSFLDRSNVGNARIEGLTEDLNMTGNQYLTGLTLYFIGYVLFEVSIYRSLPSSNMIRLTLPVRYLATLS